MGEDGKQNKINKEETHIDIKEEKKSIETPRFLGYMMLVF